MIYSKTTRYPRIAWDCSSACCAGELRRSSQKPITDSFGSDATSRSNYQAGCKKHFYNGCLDRFLTGLGINEEMEQEMRLAHNYDEVPNIDERCLPINSTYRPPTDVYQAVLDDCGGQFDFFNHTPKQRFQAIAKHVVANPEASTDGNLKIWKQVNGWLDNLDAALESLEAAKQLARQNLPLVKPPLMATYRSPSVEPFLVPSPLTPRASSNQPESSKKRSNAKMRGNEWDQPESSKKQSNWTTRGNEWELGLNPVFESGFSGSLPEVSKPLDPANMTAADHANIEFGTMEQQMEIAKAKWTDVPSVSSIEGHFEKQAAVGLERMRDFMRQDSQYKGWVEKLKSQKPVLPLVTETRIQNAIQVLEEVRLLVSQESEKLLTWVMGRGGAGIQKLFAMDKRDYMNRISNTKNRKPLKKKQPSPAGPSREGPEQRSESQGRRSTSSS
jgi:hypothetical protein